jgi:uncharacterized protein YcbK (DUF882 family)
MLKAMKVATMLSVACVTGAYAAPGPKDLDRTQSASGTTLERVHGSACRQRSCGVSQRKSSHRAKTAHRGRASAYERRHRSRRHNAQARRASSDAPRSCLTRSARALLTRIESQFGPVRVISTCRPGATIAGTGRPSRHASGNAVDFDAGDRKSKIVAWLIANHKSGGTMTYPRMSHIHVDIGPHFVSIAGGRHYASWSSRRKAGNRADRVAKSHIRRGPRVAHVDSSDD